MNLFEHFVDAQGVLKYQHLLQSRHLQSCDATLIDRLLLLSCSLGLWLAQRVQRLQSTIEQLKVDGLWHYLDPVRQD